MVRPARRAPRERCEGRRERPLEVGQQAASEPGDPRGAVSDATIALDGKALSPDSLARLKKLDPRDLPAVAGKPRVRASRSAVST